MLQDRLELLEKEEAKLKSECSHFYFKLMKEEPNIENNKKYEELKNKLAEISGDVLNVKKLLNN